MVQERIERKKKMWSAQASFAGKSGGKPPHSTLILFSQLNADFVVTSAFCVV